MQEIPEDTKPKDKVDIKTGKTPDEVANLIKYIIKKPHNQRTEEEVDVLVATLAGTSFIKERLTDNNSKGEKRNIVALKMEDLRDFTVFLNFKEIGANQTCLTYGDYTTDFYMILKGTVSV